MANPAVTSGIGTAAATLGRILNPVTNGISGIVGNGISSVMSSVAQKQGADVAYQRQNELMDKQNAWNLDMWNKQNEYNSPAEQAKRLREAGLNPVFAGLDGTGNAAQLQSSSPAQVDNPVQFDPNAMLAMAQAEKLRAETDTEDELRDARKAEIMEKTNKLKKEIDSLDVDIQTKEILKQYADANEQAKLNEIESRIELNKAQQRKADKEAEKIEKYLNEMFPEEINRIRADIDLKNATKDEKEALIRKYDAEIELIAEKLKLTKKEVLYYCATHLSGNPIVAGIQLGMMGLAKVTEDEDPQAPKDNPTGNKGGYNVDGYSVDSSGKTHHGKVPLWNKYINKGSGGFELGSVWNLNTD